ncbi:MAG: 2Fe-2S iron-sulfur cluster binding domain-containing protein [Archangiaceae bacterium]|nr:2Fe-2S iron-sulfur cluster binding domain-containing protein [Archangiaceae bacterium]
MLRRLTHRSGSGDAQPAAAAPLKDACEAATDCVFHESRKSTSSLDDVMAAVRKTYRDHEVGLGAKTWEGTRPFVVSGRVDEAPGVVSFYLEPKERQTLPLFHPGQFITVSVKKPGEAAPTMRSYSLSDSWSADRYRITVKSAGGVSTALHELFPQGAEVEVMAPNGKFFLNGESRRPVVLIGAGVGLTPVLAMAKTLASQGSLRPVHFFVSVKDGENFPFRAELEALTKEHPNLQLHVLFSRPSAADREGADYRWAGRLNALHIAEALPKTEAGNDYEFYMCGPDAMMQDVRKGLRQLTGVSDKDINFESFNGEEMVDPWDVPPPIPNAASGAVEIHFQGKSFIWNPGDEALLKTAEKNGVDLPYGCRVGLSGCCDQKLSDGSVVYPEGTLVNVSPQMARPCVAYPGEGSDIITLGTGRE